MYTAENKKKAWGEVRATRTTTTATQTGRAREGLEGRVRVGRATSFFLYFFFDGWYRSPHSSSPFRDEATQITATRCTAERKRENARGGSKQ